MKTIFIMSLLILTSLVGCTHSNQKQAPMGSQKQLPMGAPLNDSWSTFKKPAADECFIACYTEQNKHYVVAGYYLTKGKYEGRICHPVNFTGELSRKDSIYSIQCSSLPNCKRNICWAGGDTGGFVGY